MNTLIVLAAGEGNRLKPYTENVPKCMVPLRGITLIERNLSQWSKAGKFNVIVVSGYKSDCLKRQGYQLIDNPIYSSTNMVWSLLMSLPLIEKIQEEFIYVCYGDIIMGSKNIKALMSSYSDADIALIIDEEWESLWSMRMDDYMKDVESLKYKDNKVIEIGKKDPDISEVQGQYTGVIKFKRNILIEELKAYESWVKDSINKEVMHSRRNMYLTDFIQNYIDKNGAVKPVLINGGWLEVDSAEDLLAYENNWSKFSFLAPS